MGVVMKKINILSLFMLCMCAMLFFVSYGMETDNPLLKEIESLLDKVANKLSGEALLQDVLIKTLPSKAGGGFKEMGAGQKDIEDALYAIQSKNLTGIEERNRLAQQIEDLAKNVVTAKNAINKVMGDYAQQWLYEFAPNSIWNEAVAQEAIKISKHLNIPLSGMVQIINELIKIRAKTRGPVKKSTSLFGGDVYSPLDSALEIQAKKNIEEVIKNEAEKLKMQKELEQAPKEEKEQIKQEIDKKSANVLKAKTFMNFWVDKLDNEWPANSVPTKEWNTIIADKAILVSMASKINPSGIVMIIDEIIDQKAKKKGGSYAMYVPMWSSGELSADLIAQAKKNIRIAVINRVRLLKGKGTSKQSLLREQEFIGTEVPTILIPTEEQEITVITPSATGPTPAPAPSVVTPVSREIPAEVRPTVSSAKAAPSSRATARKRGVRTTSARGRGATRATSARTTTARRRGATPRRTRGTTTRRTTRRQRVPQQQPKPQPQTPPTEQTSPIENEA
jgi:hypothetical protein